MTWFNWFAYGYIAALLFLALASVMVGASA